LLRFLDHTHTHTQTHTHTRVVSELAIGASQRPLTYTTNTRDEHPYPQRDSNPRFNQLGGFGPASLTTWQPGSTKHIFIYFTSVRKRIGYKITVLFSYIYCCTNLNKVGGLYEIWYERYAIGRSSNLVIAAVLKSVLMTTTDAQACEDGLQRHTTCTRAWWLRNFRLGKETWVSGPRNDKPTIW
jgi:hypothetical protein